MLYIKVAGEYMLKIDLEYRKLKRSKKEILFIRLVGNLNKNNINKIHNYIIPVIKKHKIENVILNLKKLKSMDQVGVQAIYLIKYAVKANGGNIYLCKGCEELSFKLKHLHLKGESSEARLIKNLGVKNGI